MPPSRNRVPAQLVSDWTPKNPGTRAVGGGGVPDVNDTSTSQGIPAARKVDYGDKEEEATTC
jgi:hypothetical protein